MKILFLNPHFDAKHPLVVDLQTRGLAVFVARNLNDAAPLFEMHAESLDLIFVHREAADGTGEAGLELVKKIKTHPEQSDIPFIITSQKWSDQECLQHQSGPMGANAYLKYPFQSEQAIQLIEAVTGEALGASPILESTVTSGGVSNPILLSDPPTVFGGINDIQLENPSLPSISMGDIPSVAQVAQVQDEISIQASQPIEQPPPEFDIGEPPTPPARDPREDDLPYLFGGPVRSGPDLMSIFSQPLGDAVVPGGVSQSPDIETLKKYLLLREQDVAALSTQLKDVKQNVAALEQTIKDQSHIIAEKDSLLQEKTQLLEQFEGEKALEVGKLNAQMNELKSESRDRAEKARVLEKKVREATQEVERIKERVRSDLQKIRNHERELENRLEILKKDSEVLIAARESRIVELKRKVDLLEFNIDLAQEKLVREKEENARLRDKLTKASQAMKVAGGLLGDEEKSQEKSKAAS